MKKKILCVDDQPGGSVYENVRLVAALGEIFKDSPYELIYAPTWAEYVKVFAQDKNRDIALVLLDYNLGDKFQSKDNMMNGPEIADDLYKRRPDIRFIGLTSLTDRGVKIEFGNKNNKGGFLTKAELETEGVFLANLSHAIISDYANKNISAVWNPHHSLLTLTLAGEQPIDILIPPGHKRGGLSVSQMLSVALWRPNRLAGPFPNPAEAVHTINALVREKTQGKAWGLLTTEGAPVGCFKVLIGGAQIDDDGLPVCPPEHSFPLKCVDQVAAVRKQLVEQETKIKKLTAAINSYRTSVTSERAVLQDMMATIIAKLDLKRGKS